MRAPGTRPNLVLGHMFSNSMQQSTGEHRAIASSPRPKITCSGSSLLRMMAHRSHVAPFFHTFLFCARNMPCLHASAFAAAAELMNVDRLPFQHGGLHKKDCHRCVLKHCADISTSSEEWCFTVAV